MVILSFLYFFVVFKIFQSMYVDVCYNNRREVKFSLEKNYFKFVLIQLI